MSKEKFEKPANDYSKPELVYAVSLMLNLHDMQKDVQKLSKPALWRIFDWNQEKGNSFANLEDKIRKLERENNDLETRAIMAERKVKAMEKRRGKSTKTYK